MKRLTEPSINPYTNKVGGYIQNNKEIKHINFFGDGRDLDILKVFDKLGRYEDLEEELGIDLIILFKSLKNGIYAKEDDEIKHKSVRSIESECLSVIYDFAPTPECDEKAYYKDYGKTWALTKEELKGEEE